jgi:hypothetical protein
VAAAEDDEVGLERAGDFLDHRARVAGGGFESLVRTRFSKAARGGRVDAAGRCSASIARNCCEHAIEFLDWKVLAQRVVSGCP